METVVIDAEVVEKTTAEAKNDSVDKFFEIALRSDQVDNMLEVVKNTQIMTAEHGKFLAEHKGHLQNVVTKTHMWRTEGQHRSILSDTYHPTTHGKFQQAILEQKVFLTEATRLAKDFEKLKIETRKLFLNKEEKELELDEIISKKVEPINATDGIVYANITADPYKKAKQDLRIRRLEAEIDEIEIDIKAKQMELNDCKIAMTYRMKEVVSWQNLQGDLMGQLALEGYSEDEMFDKQAGEVEYQFFWGLNNYQGITVTKDGAEKVNLIALARHGVEQAVKAGKFDVFAKRCNRDQLWALSDLGYIIFKKESDLPKE